MEEIKYMEKPDWVSWEDVIQCIRSSDTVNQKRGLHMHIATVTPEEMEEDLKEGKCLVAMCGEKVVGTTSLKIRELRKWYRWGKVIYHSYDGILPEYQGTDVYIGLKQFQKKIEKEFNIRVHQFHTAEKNKTVIKINLKYGFKKVLFRPNFNGSAYYSVTLVKWEDGCPFPDWYLKTMFNLTKFVTKTFFTTEGKFRPSLKRYING